jgi:hypothetical protein
MKTEADFINAVIRKSTSAWFETHGRIYGKNREAGVIKPRCNYLQAKTQRVVDKMNELEMPVRIIRLKPRQKGSTTYGCALDYTKLRREPTSGVIIGGQVAQVDEAWAMLQTYQKNDSFNWNNTGDINSKSGSWSNGSRVIRETAGDAKAGIGGTHQFLHAFEVARWQEDGVAASSEVLGNILKCVPLLPSTMIDLESTAEGQTGSFYRYWLNGIDAEKFLSGEVEITKGQFVRIFAPWFQFDDSAIRLTPEQKRQIEQTLDAEEWHEGEGELIATYGVTGDDGVMRLGETVQDYDAWEQLAWRRWSIENECRKDRNLFDRDYPHSWQTAFQKSGNQRFGQSGLAEIRRRSMKITPQHGILEETKEKRIAFRSTSAGEAKVILFEKPIKGCRYIVGVDPMTGITQAGGNDPDYHSVICMRDGYYPERGEWKPPAVAARVVRSRWDIPILEPEIWKLSRFYGPANSNCTVVIEMNQDRGITELMKLRGANLYRREQFNKTEQTTTKAYGFQTNERTRENLVEKLAGAIRCINDVGNGVDLNDPAIIDQCENFVRKANGRSEASEGWKDDDVFGVGLCMEVIGHGTTYFPPTASAWYHPPGMRKPMTQTPPGAFS